MPTTRRQLILRAAFLLPSLLISGSEADAAGAAPRRRKKPATPKTTTFVGKYQDLTLRVPVSLKKTTVTSPDTDALADKGLSLSIYRAPLRPGMTTRDFANTFCAGVQETVDSLEVTQVSDTRLGGIPALRVQATAKKEKQTFRLTYYFVTRGEVVYAITGVHEGEAGGRAMQNVVATLVWKTAPQVTRNSGGAPTMPAGAGQRACSNCGGAGRVNCSYCYGRGRDTRDSNKVCQVCYDWSGKKTCTTCWGRGFVAGY